MDIFTYWQLIRRQWWVIVLCVMVTAVSTYLFTRAQTPLYQATSTLLVQQASNQAGAEYRDLLASERLALSYAQRLTNNEVLAQAITQVEADMTVEQLQSLVAVNLLPETQLITLRVRHPDPESASTLANTIPTIFAQRNTQQQRERFALARTNLQTEIETIQQELIQTEQQLAQEQANTPPDTNQLAQLNSDLLFQRETYANLLQSSESLRLAEVNNLNTLLIDERAITPTNPALPNMQRNLVLAVCLGFLLGFGLVIVGDYLDDTLKTPEAINAHTGLSTLGLIRLLPATRPAETLVVEMTPRSPDAEAYRQLRTNIQFVGVSKPFRTILVTSAGMGDGKSTVAANLAAVLAQSGKQVILIDADMRRPMVHQLLEINNSRGLSNLIFRGNEDPSFLQGTLVSNLRVLSAGRIPPNPAELLGSERMREVIAWLQTQADYIIFDTPPLLAVTDAAVLSRLVDSTLLVVRAGKTRLPMLTEAIRKLQALESHIAGVVLNGLKFKEKGSYYQPYTYTQEEDTTRPQTHFAALIQRLTTLF